MSSLMMELKKATCHGQEICIATNAVHDVDQGFLVAKSEWQHLNEPSHDLNGHFIVTDTRNGPQYVAIQMLVLATVQ